MIWTYTNILWSLSRPIYVSNFSIWLQPIINNIAGHEKGAEKGLYNHEVCISSDQFIHVTQDWIPTGEMANVGSNPLYDLRIPKVLGDIIPLFPQEGNKGYAHNYCTKPSLVESQNVYDMR